jgi:predicted HTH domain antitoxin
MQLSIPESIIQSIRLPESRIEAELLKELALALYHKEKAVLRKCPRELANLDHWQFSQLLGVGRRPVFDQRNISRYYSETELAEDLYYARCD